MHLHLCKVCRVLVSTAFITLIKAIMNSLLFQMFYYFFVICYLNLRIMQIVPYTNGDSALPAYLIYTKE
jgi:hypothetical protein